MINFKIVEKENMYFEYNWFWNYILGIWLILWIVVKFGLLVGIFVIIMYILGCI